MTYIETDCTIEHDGRKFSQGGAMVTPDRIVAYVGKLIDVPGQIGGRRNLTDWHGKIIGTCQISSTWRIAGPYGTTMSQIYATVGGVRYVGRGQGEGMVFTGKATAR